MDDKKVIAKLQTLVEVLGSQKVAAISLGISTQYLNDLLRGRRNVSEEIAGKLGFTAEWVANDERLLTPRAPDKCGRCPHLEGISPNRRVRRLMVSPIKSRACR